MKNKKLVYSILKLVGELVLLVAVVTGLIIIILQGERKIKSITREESIKAIDHFKQALKTNERYIENNLDSLTQEELKEELEHSEMCRKMICKHENILKMVEI